MAFTQKEIEIDLILQDGGGNTFRGLACDVSVEKVGLPDKNKATVTIWGLSLQHIEEFTALQFRPLEYKRNKLRIRAGENGKLDQIFSGDILVAHGDGSGAPDFAFKIEAHSGLFMALTPEAPETVKGETQVGDIVSKIAGENGYTFESQEGDNVPITNAVLQGSPFQKAQLAAEQVGRELVLDDDTLLLMPDTGVRHVEVVRLSAETGLLGYPTFTTEGIACKSLYNPNIMYGGELVLSSVLPHASGSWRITKVVHNLSAWKSGGGPWFTEIEALTKLTEYNNNGR